MNVEHFKIRSRRYATVVIRWVLVAVVVFAATVSAGIYVTNHLLVKVYSATASIQLSSQPGEAPQAFSGLAFTSSQNSGVTAELDSIESPELLQGVVSTLSLDKAWAARIFERSDPLTTEEAVQYLTSHLRLKFKHDSNVVEVTAMSDDPAEAAAIANQVAEDYEALRQHEAVDQLGSVQTATAPASGEVKIKSRAEVPTTPSHPNKRFCYAVAAGLGGMLSVMVASAIEVCLLIARAEDAAREMLPSR